MSYYNTSKLTLLKVLLSAVCVVYVLLLAHTLTKRELINGSDGEVISSAGTRSRSTFAVFLVLQSFTENRSLATGNADVRQLVNRYFKLPNCDTTKSFHLYWIRYTEEPALATKQSFNESFKHCQQHVPIVVDDLLIKDPNMDGRFFRDVILDAYLDNVDYYYIVLSDGITTEESKKEVDLLHWKDILLQRSPHGVGVVATINHKESGSISKLFFSKIHMEMFGAAFPFTNETLESVLSYMVLFYSSNRLATVVEGGKKVLENQPPQRVKTYTYNWTEHHSQDSITLHRYLSAVEASQSSWRSISSSRNVIAMSLYGSNRRYTLGALRNAQLLPVIFPGWHLWFYCEKPLPDGSVRYGKTPEKILRKIMELGAEIQYVDTVATGLAPMLWRFLVAEDLDVDAFVVRDCDSRLTPRDATVISEWLKTNSSFHCIRDHPSHKWHPINGGLWGGRPKALHRALDGVTKQVMKLYGGEYFDDMRFLARQVWPKVKDVAFCHDSVSCDSFPNSHPFPVKRIGFEHLGQVYDENSQVKQYDMDIIASAKVNTNCTPT